MPAVAITDHGEVGGHYSFQKACQAEGVKPIFGMEGYLVDSIQRVRTEKDRENSHITLLAESQVGLHNLWKLSTRAYAEGKYYKPLADWPMFAEHHEGMIATSGCLLSYLPRAILKEDHDKCVELIGQYLATFGEDNFFLELHTFQLFDPQSDDNKALNVEMTKMNAGLVDLSKEFSIPMIVVNDSHYTYDEEWENHRLVWAMSINADQTDNEHANQHIQSEDEVYSWMAKQGIARSVVESAIDNTTAIANRCDAEISGTLHMPRVTDSDEDDIRLFKKQVEEGFEVKVVQRGLDVAKYRERVDEEVALILGKDYAGYFNIVTDYTKWARGQGMLIGPSRGSVGGSLTAYCLDIITMDPIKYGLLFGRFIDPGRISMPDIDLDFPQSRRPEIKAYLERKYGHECISGVGTFTRLKPRSILQDLCRAMSIPIDDSKKMGKIIEQVRDIDTWNVIVTWDNIITERGGDLKPWAMKYPLLFEKIGQMQGLIRQSSTHAAGILISDAPLIDLIPLRMKGDELVTQFENAVKNPEVEDLGFLKFDVLGLRHLDTLTVARDLVQKRHGVYLDYDNFTDEQYNDPEMWKMIEEARTTGCFQIETSVLTMVGKRFKPKNQIDLADLISVARPGVLRSGQLEPYLRRRQGKEVTTYLHPLLESILARTYGIPVYQEQIMLITRFLSGYTMQEADKVRKIMGKMQYKEMKHQRVKFIDGCLANQEYLDGCKEDPTVLANQVFDMIEGAGIYSYNMSHAQGYALITSWEIYLKYHYPREFLTACLVTDPVRQSAYIREARRLRIPILPPDVNSSESQFTLTDEGIRYGLSAVKQIGPSAVNEIVDRRPYDSLVDYLTKTSSMKGRKKQVVNNLICIGGFDTTGVTREVALKEFYAFRKETPDPELVPDFTNPSTILDLEIALVGDFITNDPIVPYLDVIEEECIHEPEDIDILKIGDRYVVGGKLARIKEFKARNGLMGFIECIYNEEIFNLTIFADAYARFKPMLQSGKPVVCVAERLREGGMLKDLIRLDLL